MIVRRSTSVSADGLGASTEAESPPDAYVAIGLVTRTIPDQDIDQYGQTHRTTTFRRRIMKLVCILAIIPLALMSLMTLGVRMPVSTGTRSTEKGL